jgi:hypothetical protein
MSSKRSKLYWIPSLRSDSWVGSQKYHHLAIEILELAPPNPAFHDSTVFPLPVLDTPGSRRIGITMEWQANEGETAEGTVDGRRWYGGSVKCELHSCEIPKALRWICRQFPGDDPSPRQVIDAFVESGIQQVAYSVPLSKHVLARHWHDAEHYRGYYDVGAMADSASGCIINAYVHQDFDDDTVTRAVEEALRKSRYCSVDELVRWVEGGRRWSPASTGGDHSHHLPLTVPQILGEPSPAAATKAA